MYLPARALLVALSSCIFAATTASAWGAGSPFADSPRIITEQAKLLGPGETLNDRFGWSVAVSAQTAIIGARDEDGSIGAAYVFIRSGSGWVQQARLTPSTGGYWFGSSVAISGDTAVVGAFLSRSFLNFRAGAAYVFVRNGSIWSEQAIFLAPDAKDFDGFSSAVAISGDTIAVGAATSDNSPTLRSTGAVYVFVRQGTSWSFQAKLLASDGQAGDGLGSSLALSGGELVVGAPHHNPTGAVYFFQRNGSTWDEQAELLAPDSALSRLFGASVARSGGTLVVGAPPPWKEPAVDVGAAHVFVGQGSSWSPQARLLASDGEPDHLFGWHLALSGSNLVVGAAGTDDDPGAAYAFTRSGTQWSEHGKLLASDGEPWDALGASVAISGGTAMVGAPLADGGALYLFPIPGVTVSPAAGFFTFEGGGTASLTVVPNTEPTGDIVIDLASNDPGEGTVSPARLTFTTGDWSIPQTVTLTGVDDFVDDNGQVYTVSLTINQELTEDLIYDEIDPEDVSAVNLEFNGDFYTVPPCRVLDTRQPEQEPPLASGVDRVVAFHGTCGVPATARAVAINVTVVEPTGDGSLSLYPTDLPYPGLDTFTFAAERNRTNNVIVLLAIDGTGTLKVAPLVANGGSAHLAIDLAGYFE